MTMYLPNPDLQPTGAEPGEFLDLPPMGDVAPPPGFAPQTADPAPAGAAAPDDASPTD